MAIDDIRHSIDDISLGNEWDSPNHRDDSCQVGMSGRLEGMT
jgi:hypothetical protein